MFSKTGNVRVNVNIEEISSNQCCSGKSISIAYSECVFVTLGTQHAIRVRSIIMSSVASPAVIYFSTLPHKRHDFRETFIENKMYYDLMFF